MTNRERIDRIVELYADISIEITQGENSIDRIRKIILGLPSTEDIQELANWAEYGTVDTDTMNILDEAALLVHDAEHESLEKLRSTVDTVHKLWYTR
jgi:hypothetical protein